MRYFRHPVLAVLMLFLAVLPGMVPHTHGHALDGGGPRAAEEIRSHTCGDREYHIGLEDLRACPLCRTAEPRTVIPAETALAAAPVPVSPLPTCSGCADLRQAYLRTAAGLSPPTLS